MDYQPIWIKNNFQSKLPRFFMALIVMQGICGKFYILYYHYSMAYGRLQSRIKSVENSSPPASVKKYNLFFYDSEQRW